MVLYSANLSAGLVEANEMPLAVELRQLWILEETGVSFPIAQLDRQDPTKERVPD